MCRVEGKKKRNRSTQGPWTNWQTMSRVKVVASLVISLAHNERCILLPHVTCKVTCSLIFTTAKNNRWVVQPFVITISTCTEPKMSIHLLVGTAGHEATCIRLGCGPLRLEKDRNETEKWGLRRTGIERHTRTAAELELTEKMSVIGFLASYQSSERAITCMRPSASAVFLHGEHFRFFVWLLSKKSQNRVTLGFADVWMFPGSFS